MELVFVEAGSFMMGSEDDETDESPEHQVRITRPFWIGKYEVTQAEHKAVMGTNPSHHNGPRKPVEAMSWNDAVTFCGRLTDREHRAGRLPEGHEFRLPTEAEWEYAARGGPASRNAEYAGGNDLDEVAWHWRNSGGRTHEAGKMKANELGLYDMSGNVYEWCWDRYDDGYFGASPPADPSGPPTATNRVSRGGSCSLDGTDYRIARRDKIYPGSTSCTVGFRVVLAPSIEQPEK